MSHIQNEWAIIGITNSGEVFDVPEWPERLCGMLADRAGDKRICYSEYLTPAIINGIPSVILLGKLERDDPDSYEVVRKFIAENHLRVRPGRNGTATSIYPVMQQERRQYIRA